MDEQSIVRALAALLIVLGLLGGLWWGLRRFTSLVPNTQTGADLRVVTWRPFDGRRKLAVIRWGEEEHLVITGPYGDTVLAHRPAPPTLQPEEQA